MLGAMHEQGLDEYRGQIFWNIFPLFCTQGVEHLVDAYTAARSKGGCIAGTPGIHGFRQIARQVAIPGYFLPGRTKTAIQGVKGLVIQCWRSIQLTAPWEQNFRLERAAKAMPHPCGRAK